MTNDLGSRRVFLMGLAVVLAPPAADAALAAGDGRPAGIRPLEVTAEDGVVVHGTLTEVASPKALAGR